MISLNQAFYGRDPIRGYRLLASSDNRFNKTVEMLCAAIGSPDGISSIEPFYLNYINNGFRYMISCCIGNPDDSGRKTLFFHVFIGQHQDLINKRFGISSLIHQKAFLSKCSSGPVLSMDFEEDLFTIPWEGTSIKLDERLAIQSSKPELSIIAGILKGKINEMSWASFTFQPLPDFQLYVISQFVAPPRDRKCVTISGELVSLPKRKEDTPQIQKNNLNVSKNKTKMTTLTRVSVFLNIVLLGACVVLFVQKNNTSSYNSIEEKTKPVKDDPEQITINTNPVHLPSITEPNKNNEPDSSQSQTQIVSVSRESVINDLRDEFNDSYNNPFISIEDYRKEMTPRFSRVSDDKKQLLLKAEHYIIFINKTFFKEDEEN